ncbi:N4-gp56 family major capsid protein [Limosilactobacillus reuteri]|uniref:N4-gp56 family major capsid protein n=1 Tax=Limosilactobacillus reuteri TaxID=1598 RepID=UPI00234AFA1F|nr:N4-gp56 family major capsid protein [Limosilactobacillus reuteri]MDC6076624.1 N4-gp56 family major capsid protein [Limosilactobacillus reuteri]
MPDNVTRSENVLDPEVLAAMVSAKLTAGMKFAPLAQVDNTLVGAPGSTIEFPAWNYIGDAEDITEGEPIDESQLTYGKRAATIKEVGKGAPITDTAIAIGIGNPEGELVSQLSTSIDNKRDNDCLECLKGATQTASVEPTVDGLQQALDTFNFEDDHAQIVLVCSPKAAGQLRLSGAKEFTGAKALQDPISSGVYGELLGVQIIRSRKLEANEAYLVVTNASDGRPAMKLTNKKGVRIEPQRDASRRLTHYYATAMYAAYLYDPTKVVKVTFNGVTGPSATTGAPTPVTDKVADGTEPNNVPEDKRVGRQKKTTKKNTTNTPTADK